MEGVCSGEEVHLRQAQPEALSHTDKIPFGKAGKMSDTKGEMSGCRVVLGGTWRMPRV